MDQQKKKGIATDVAIWSELGEMFSFNEDQRIEQKDFDWILKFLPLMGGITLSVAPMGRSALLPISTNGIEWINWQN